MLFPMTLWIDGGLDTGLAWLWDGGRQFRAEESRFDAAADAIEQTCRQWGPGLAIGWERYTIRMSMPQTDAQHAIGINWVAKRYARVWGCYILDEGAQYTPKPHDRRELEAIGWWVRGKDDAQSAACHMLRYLRRSGNLPPREAAILSELASTI